MREVFAPLLFLLPQKPSASTYAILIAPACAACAVQINSRMVASIKSMVFLNMIFLRRIFVIFNMQPQFPAAVALVQAA